MNFSVRQYSWFCLAFVALLFSSWFFSRELPYKKLDAETLSVTPDMIIQGLTMRKFDERGKLANQLDAPFVQHFPKDDSHILQKPYIRIYQPDETAMEIRSAKAHSVQRGETITFIKNVIVDQVEANGVVASTLKTEKIIYQSKQKIASTDLPVTFEQAGNVVQSTGMTAWLEEKRVKLLSQARGRYVPKQHG